MTEKYLILMWEWIVSCPNIPMLKEPVKRVSWITRDQAEKLLSFLAEHQQFMMRFALETGLRRHNVTHLEWSQVNLDKRVAWIHPDQAKAEKAIGVPLSAEAVLILRGQVGKHESWVFPYKGLPVTQTATKTRREAVKKAGISPEICARYSAIKTKIENARKYPSRMLSFSRNKKVFKVNKKGVDESKPLSIENSK